MCFVFCLIELCFCIDYWQIWATETDHWETWAELIKIGKKQNSAWTFTKSFKCMAKSLQNICRIGGSYYLELGHIRTQNYSIKGPLAKLRSGADDQKQKVNGGSVSAIKTLLTTDYAWYWNSWVVCASFQVMKMATLTPSREPAEDLACTQA